MTPPPPAPRAPTKTPPNKKTILLACGIGLALLAVLVVYLGPIKSFQRRQAEESLVQQTLDEAEKLYAQAETDAKLGDYEAALIGATQALDENPKHEKAQSLVTTLRPKVVISSIDYAKSYRVQGDYPAALKKLNGALTLDPTNEEALALYAEIDALNRQAVAAAATPPAPKPAPQATAPPVEAATPKSAQLHLTEKERKEMNLFLSNFSEANFGVNGSNGAITDFTQAELLRFVLCHNEINAPDNVGYDDDNDVLSDGVVDKTLKRFFGLGIKHGSAGEFLHENGKYYTPAADGESSQYYTVATSYAPTETGSIQVKFKVYAINQNDSFDYSRYYAYTEAQADADAECAVQYSGVAKLIPIVHNGENTYRLAEYSAYT